jgi:selenocysteine-specific translation elongation factor
MKEFFSSYEDQINEINAIMMKLKQLIPAAKLRSFTHLKVKTKNARRWSSTIAMILRYTKIKQFLPRLEVNEIDDLVLSAKENRDIDALLEELKDLETVSKTSQNDSTAMSDAR